MDSPTVGQARSGKPRFGVFEFDLQTHELTKHGTRLKVQEQPLQVLAALVEHAGQIVSREELRHRLWPEGTFVDFEQSLNKAVNKLREALGDSADKPVYIETLARRGYRFLAPVELVVETAPKRRWWPWLAAAAAVLAGVLGTGLWPIEVPQVVNIVRLTGDDSRKLRPLVADGSRVLFSDLKDIWSVSSDGGRPKRIPMPFLPATAAQVGLDISGRSTQTILLGAWPNAKGTVDVWLAKPDGEAPRKVGEIAPFPCSHALAPDGERFAVSLPDGVYIWSIATGERRRIQPMQWQRPSVLWWHPSGHIVGFLDIPKEATKTRAWQVNDDGAGLRRIVPEMEHGQGEGAWSLDGKRFYYSSLEKGGEIWVRVQARILGWLRKPVVTRLTASGQFQAAPTVDPVDPKRLYVTASVLRGETVRYDRAARKWVPFLAGFSGELIEWSPDGQSMVYVRYPGLELHKCKPDGSGDVVLAPGVLAYHPVWSPDGKRIAFAGRPSGATQPWKLWLVSASGGDAAPYKPEVESGYDPAWSSDGKKMLLGQHEAKLAPGESRVKILDLETGKLEQLPGGERLFSTRWSPDGKQICGVDLGTLTLYFYEPAKKAWRALKNKDVGSFPTWSDDGRYIYGWINKEEVLGRVEVATGRREEIVRLDFRRTANLGPWVGWTKDWEPLVLRDTSSTQIYRIDLDR